MRRGFLAALLLAGMLVGSVNAASFSGSVAYYSTAGLGAIYITGGFTATSVTWSSGFVVFTGYNSLMTLGLKNPVAGTTMTVDSVTHDQIKYTIAGGVAAATWSLYLPSVNSAECQTVVGVTGWAWDGNTKIITVTQDTYPLQVTIGLTWGGGGGGGSGIADIDGDGIPNETDPDMDGDALLNGADIDLDGDGAANPVDSDMDSDGVPNDSDPDMDSDGLLNGNDADMDGDQIANSSDSDVDGDGTANIVDSDIDGDGVQNDFDPDIDGDGLINANDPTPKGVSESTTTPSWIPTFLQPTFTWIQQNATMAVMIGLGGVLAFLATQPKKKQRRGLNSVFKERQRR